MNGLLFSGKLGSQTIKLEITSKCSSNMIYIDSDQILNYLTKDDLKEIGIRSVGHQIRILNYIDKRRQSIVGGRTSAERNQDPADNIKTLMEEVDHLKDKLNELLLEISLIHVGEAAADLLASPSKKAKSAPHLANYSFNPSADLDTILIYLKNRRNTSSHASKQHRDVHDNFLQEKVEDILKADDYFVKKKNEAIARKHISEVEISLIKKHKSNF